MSEILDFGAVVLIVAGGFAAAVWLTKATERFPLPSPALFLLGAAVASDVFPGLGVLSIKGVERVAVVALIVILFDGGMHIGGRRLRTAAAPVVALGVLGTFGTAAVIAVFTHELLDFGWTPALIVGAALAPTDPAVMFSVLGNKEIGGRAGTILEGESGANDPVGIALMIGMIDFATHTDASAWVVAREFSIEMAVGLAVGVAAAGILLPLLRHISLPRAELYSIQTLAAAGMIYGAATIAHGSGFLAVFVAGLLVGDSDAPNKREIERFHTSLASLAEIVVFAALGLSVHLSSLGEDQRWRDGLVLAVFLALVARPIVAWPLLAPARLKQGERLFVMWSGLKGAVPILLATFPLLNGLADGTRIYGIVFVVVAFSVIVQGSSIPLVARWLGVEMRAPSSKE